MGPKVKPPFNRTKDLAWLHTNITFGQVSRVLAERWKALNDKQRAPYEAKAAQDKKRYEDEKAKWQATM